MTKEYQRRLNAVKASIRCSDRIQDSISHKAEKVAYSLKTGDFSMAEACRTSYYELLNKYKYNTLYTTPNNDKVAKLWERVAESVTKSGCTVDHYMKAQFQWFHSAFTTFPKITQLATTGAQDRAKLYTLTERNITANSLPAKKDIASLFRNSENQMRALCDARKMTRAEVYKQLVKPGLFMFPQEFLDADPEYARCK